jgi:hypothetical protein
MPMAIRHFKLGLIMTPEVKPSGDNSGAVPEPLALRGFSPG